MNEDLFRMFSTFVKQYTAQNPSATTTLQGKEVKGMDQAGSSQTNVQCSVQELASSDDESLFSSNGM